MDIGSQADAVPIECNCRHEIKLIFSLDSLSPSGILANITVFRTSLAVYFWGSIPTLSGAAGISVKKL
jgi:hypothetical protein